MQGCFFVLLPPHPDWKSSKHCLIHSIEICVSVTHFLRKDSLQCNRCRDVGWRHLPSTNPWFAEHMSCVERRIIHMPCVERPVIYMSCVERPVIYMSCVERHVIYMSCVERHVIYMSCVE